MEGKHNSFGAKNIVVYLSLDIICCPKLSPFRISEQVMSEQQQKKKTIVHVFAPNGDYCLLRVSEIVGRVYRLLQRYTFISA